MNDTERCGVDALPASNPIMRVGSQLSCEGDLGGEDHVAAPKFVDMTSASVGSRAENDLPSVNPNPLFRLEIHHPGACTGRMVFG